MFSTEATVKPSVFPFVFFINTEGKEFLIERDRITHAETYERDGVLDHEKTFVNFKSPNHKSKGSLHAVVEMPLRIFRERILRVAYEGSPTPTS